MDYTCHHRKGKITAFAVEARMRKTYPTGWMSLLVNRFPVSCRLAIRQYCLGPPCRKPPLNVCVIGIIVWASVTAFGNLVAHPQGTVTLEGSGSYQWWYGCSPTSAGMMMGYYDGHGYSNLVPDGQAESHTFGSGPYRVNEIIASPGHITDFYGGGFGSSDDDHAAPWHSFDCLADFMGTSQDAYGNPNGTTIFWYYESGTRLYDWDIRTFDVYHNSGMYGIHEYVTYSGYQIDSLFNQYIAGYGEDQTLGFTFTDYISEIDAGRPVMIHVDGHSMYGYGYDLDTTEVLLYDTWTSRQQRMTWGGTYDDRAHFGVTVLHLAVPEPSTLLLLGVGGLLARRRLHPGVLTER